MEESPMASKMGYVFPRKFHIPFWTRVDWLPFLPGSIVRIAPNHLSFNSHAAQKVIYGFGTRTVPSMVKDPIFFTPEVDHSMNIINETDREEHSRMRRMLSFAFSTSNLLENEEVLVRRTTEFIQRIRSVQSIDGRKGFNVVKEFNYVTFNIMGRPRTPFLIRWLMIQSRWDVIRRFLRLETRRTRRWTDIPLDKTTPS